MNSTGRNTTLDYINSIVALIGCSTGILALTLHLSASKYQPPEQLTLRVDMTQNVKDAAHPLIKLMVTNLGERPAYILSATLRVPLDTWAEYDFTSADPPGSVIHPGGYCNYNLSSFTIEGIENIVETAQGDLEVRVVTTRGNQFSTSATDTIRAWALLYRALSLVPDEVLPKQKALKKRPGKEPFHL